jgi:hypothetical protein
MDRRVTRPIVSLLLAGFLMIGDVAEARSFMSHLREIGNAITHPQQKKSRSHTRKKRHVASKHAMSSRPSPTPGPIPIPIPISSSRPSLGPPSEPNVRTATAAPQTRGAKRDAPYAIPVPGKQGLVTSPYAPDAGYVDVHQFPAGVEVKDPFSGKVFRTP